MSQVLLREWLCVSRKFYRETSAFQTAKVTNFHAGILCVLILMQIFHPYVLFGDKAFGDLGCKS